MKFALSAGLALLLVCSYSGCCHFGCHDGWWQGCNAGCGEKYYGDPYGTDCCDHCGNWTGPSDAYADQVDIGGRAYAAAPKWNPHAHLAHAPAWNGSPSTEETTMEMNSEVAGTEGLPHWVGPPEPGTTLVPGSVKVTSGKPSEPMMASEPAAPSPKIHRVKRTSHVSRTPSRHHAPSP